MDTEQQQELKSEKRTTKQRRKYIPWHDRMVQEEVDNLNYIKKMAKWKFYKS